MEYYSPDTEKSRFISILSSCVDDAEGLVQHLETVNFFKSKKKYCRYKDYSCDNAPHPKSDKINICKHTLCVYDCLMGSKFNEEYNELAKRIGRHSLTAVVMLHELPYVYKESNPTKNRKSALRTICRYAKLSRTAKYIFLNYPDCDFNFSCANIHMVWYNWDTFLNADATASVMLSTHVKEIAAHGYDYTLRKAAFNRLIEENDQEGLCYNACHGSYGAKRESLELISDRDSLIRVAEAADKDDTDILETVLDKIRDSQKHLSEFIAVCKSGYLNCRAAYLIKDPICAAAALAKLNSTKVRMDADCLEKEAFILAAQTCGNDANRLSEYYNPGNYNRMCTLLIAGKGVHNDYDDCDYDDCYIDENDSTFIKNAEFFADCLGMKKNKDNETPYYDEEYDDDIDDDDNNDDDDDTSGQIPKFYKNVNPADDNDDDDDDDEEDDDEILSAFYGDEDTHEYGKDFFKGFFKCFICCSAIALLGALYILLFK